MAGLDQVRAELITGAARVGAALLLGLSLSCDRPASSHGSGAIQSVGGATPGRIVDSLLPPEEALRRFRVGLDTPAMLTGPRSRDELVRRFIRSVGARNRVALDSLVVTRAEFAFLVFPELKISRPPYRQPPDIAWLLTESATHGGRTKLLGRADRFELGGYRCDAPVRQEGQLRIWADCTVSLREADRVRAARLFGAIIEREGRYKFAGFANDL